MDDVKNLSAGTLAFVGDAVYGLLVRTHLSKTNRPQKQLHELSVEYVSAAAQAQAFKKIEPILTETELSVFKRGRNFHTGNTPKSATGGQYHTATGLECLFGYLHLLKETERINEFFEIIISE